MTKATTQTNTTRETAPEPEPAGFIVDLDDVVLDPPPPFDGLRIPKEGLAQVAIDAAIRGPELRRIRRHGVAVIVEIPTSDWATLVEAIMRSLGYFETVVNRSEAPPSPIGRARVTTRSPCPLRRVAASKASPRRRNATSPRSWWPPLTSGRSLGTRPPRDRDGDPHDDRP